MRAGVQDPAFSFLSVTGGAAFLKENCAVLSVSDGVGGMTGQLLFRSGRRLSGLLYWSLPVQPRPFQARLLLPEQVFLTELRSCR